MSACLPASFHPLVADWFATCIGRPTDVQARAWPVIAAGEHALVTAPTGSGKTLTAFLWALDRLLTGAWQPGGVRVLYVSPLKALNTDIRRNLLGPLAELRARFDREGVPVPDLHVQTRSGDTEARERRRLLRRPPEILITTPESLNILLSTRPGRSLFGELETVILDEIHAVAGTKRGTHLITAVDRLVPLAGEFQRIALSATVRPLETVAAFVGGYVRATAGPDPDYAPRPVTIVQSDDSKELAARVRYPSPVGEDLDAWWEALTTELKALIQEHRSTLLFTNSRRMCEKLSLFLNRGEDPPLAYSHHGSLSRETRQAVEERLKHGELKAIVATSSLELGIDIGALDQVLLVQTPPDVSAAVQRWGRAGHSVGEVSRGIIFPLHGRDLLRAAAMVPCVLAKDIEAVQPLAAPLDVLAQNLITMAGTESWDLDELFDELRCSWPFRWLSRRQYDLVLDMLGGRYSTTRLATLQPRVVVDRLANRLHSREAATRLARVSGGTIPDRGYFQLRHAETRARIGELDEEFVWERSPGDSFILGNQVWRILTITHNDVLAVPGRGGAMAPFWKGEEMSRGAHFATRCAELLETAEACLSDTPPEFRMDPQISQMNADSDSLISESSASSASSADLRESARRPSADCFAADLRERCHLEPDAATALVDFLVRQRDHTGTPLPHRHHLLVELVAQPEAEPGVPQVILHTHWGRDLNRPFALALAGAWDEVYAEQLAFHADQDCIMLTPSRAIGAAELLGLVAPGELDRLLRRRLESSGLFGARFRENAARALLLPRGMPNHRMPLWLNRERSKKLLEAVAQFDDFPILVETWRCCLQDEFDLPALRERLAELERGETTWSEAQTFEPSPFAGSVVWRETNRLMYLDDSPTGGPSRLSDELVAEVAASPHLRPRLPRDLIDALEAKLQRTWPGYAPSTAEELLELLKERQLVPESEWTALLEAIARDGAEPEALLEEIAPRAVWVGLPGARVRSVAALEWVPAIAAALGLGQADVTIEGIAGRRPAPQPALQAEEWARLTPDDDRDPLSELLGGWLQLHGPVDPARLGDLLGLDPVTLDDVLDGLAEAGRVVLGPLTLDGPPTEVCDRDNLERLLRLARRARVPTFEPLPAEALPLHLAWWQGLARRGGDEVVTGSLSQAGRERLQQAIEKLLGLPLAAELIEAELLPARVPGYQPAWLDALFLDSDLAWSGHAPKVVSLAFTDQLDLLRDELAEPAEPADPLVPAAGRYPFGELLGRGELTSERLAEALWAAVWRGEVSNDSFAALRLGVGTRFRPRALADESTRQRILERPGTGGRGGFRRWQASRPFHGNWYRLPPPEPDADPISRLERDKDRARLLLDRYGILFRELLAHELPALQWGRLFRALRLMELSGEIVSGLFFDGIPGLQFAGAGLPAALRRLPDDAIWWLNAVDPASPCGLRLGGLDDLPERRASNHLVYHGRRLVLIARRGGKELDVRVPPDSPRLSEYLAFLEAQQTRPGQPVRHLTVETINGEPARESAYLPALRERFETTADDRGVKLWRRVR